MIFTPPPEIEFLERGFDISQEHDPDEAIISYAFAYKDGSELKVTFTIGSIPSVHVSLSQSSRLVAEVTVENIIDVSFQSWSGERNLRMSFKENHASTDLRVHYEPQASIHMASLATGA